MFGFLNINKPVGPTSQGIVRTIKRMLPRGVRVGHAGTLDPFAQGVLVVCLGGACRLASFVQAASKTYHTLIMLGSTSDTDDCFGRITAIAGTRVPSADDVRLAVSGQIGSINQIPPAHSAVHVAGQRAYVLARQGQSVELSPRIVDVHAINILKYEYPMLELEIQCGSGTYIRSIARDIGLALGSGGYCQSLVRTRIGTFMLKNAIDADKVNLSQDIISPLAALEEVPKISLSPQQVAKVRMGQRIVSSARPPGETIVLLDDHGQVLALALIQSDGITVQPTRVFC